MQMEVPEHGTDALDCALAIYHLNQPPYSDEDVWSVSMWLGYVNRPINFDLVV